MADSIINTKKTDEADVVLVGVAYEKTASSHKGTKDGPDKVVECLDHQIEFFDRKFKKEINKVLKIAHEDLGDLDQLSPPAVIEKIKTACGELIENGKFIVLLGGEHSVSLGYLETLAKKYNPKDVTILQIDAHCDLRNDDGDYSDTPSKFAHSTVMRRASELGYQIAQVGVRTYSKEECEYFSDPKNGVTVFEWGNGNKIPKVEEILEAIKTKLVYITIDVDGLDPAHMPGTGTPVQGGIEWWYGVELIEKVIEKKELIGADIVEVSPTPDSVLTEYGAAQLAYTIIAHKFRDKLQKAH